MATDITDISIDNHIADALRHAILMHGECVIEDPELFEILKDHGAFYSSNCSDDIVRIIIDNGIMPSLRTLRHRPVDEIVDGIDMEVCKIKYICSFTENDIRRVLMSLLKGMNMHLYIKMSIINNNPISDTIEIDSEDVTELPSCPIPLRKPKMIQSDNLDDTIQLKATPSEKYPIGNKSNKNLKRHAITLVIALAIAVGVYVALRLETTRETGTVENNEKKSISLANIPNHELESKLKPGSSGQQVKNLVIALSNAGYLAEEDVTNVKGHLIYDDIVEKAVGHFQKDLDIRQDGIYDTKLDEILFTFWRPEYTSIRLGKRKLSASDPKAGADIDLLIEILTEAGFPPDSTKLKLSEKREFTDRIRLMFEQAGISKGEEICQRQHYYYSKDIEKSLKDFQASNGINASGELNATTLRALSEKYLRIKERQPSSYDAKPSGMKVSSR